MKTTIDLPEPIFSSIVQRAAAEDTEADEWIAELIVRVITSNEIHYLRKYVIDWSDELLS